MTARFRPSADIKSRRARFRLYFVGIKCFSRDDRRGTRYDLKKLTLELMQNGSSKVQETNQNLIQKLYGSKSDSEIEFEEEPRTAVITTQNIDNNYQEPEENYLFAETIEEEEIRIKLSSRSSALLQKVFALQD